MVILILLLGLGLSIASFRVWALLQENKTLRKSNEYLNSELNSHYITKKMDAETSKDSISAEKPTVVTADHIIDDMEPAIKDDEGKKIPYFEFYTDESGQFRWRFKAKNNKIVADSGESYTTKQNLKKGLGVLLDALSSGVYGKKDNLK